MTGPVANKHIIEKLLLSKPIDIPVFHEIALRLQQMMNDHSYRIEEVIKLVHEDTVLASEMLRHANSTYNSGKTPITTIKNAIVRLGSQQIVNLAFTASMANSQSSNPLINKHLKKLWHHNHAVAITSSLLAIQFSHEKTILNINADEVYLAGLFHGIGKLYLLKLIDGLITSGTFQADYNVIDTIINELNIQLGIKVMQHYNIPEIYSNSVERHCIEDWKCGTNDYLVAAVRLSCKIHHRIEQGIEVTEINDSAELFKDELSLLHLSDVTHVYNLAKSIAD